MKPIRRLKAFNIQTGKYLGEVVSIVNIDDLILAVIENDGFLDTKSIYHIKVEEISCNK